MKSETKHTSGEILGATYGGTKGRQLSLEFEFKALVWISKFKFTNKHVIADLFLVKTATAQNKLKKLEVKKYIRRAPCLTSRENWVYMLTQTGVTRLKEFWGYQPSRPWIDSSKVRDRIKCTHDLAVQWFCARQYSSGNLHKVQSEFELTDFPVLKITPSRRVKHKPDALITHWQENDKKPAQFYGTWAVEYEASRKSAKRLEEIFIYHYKMCSLPSKERCYWGVHYFFSRMSDAAFYEKQLKATSLNLFPEKWTHFENEPEFDENKDNRDLFLDSFYFHLIHSELRSKFYTSKTTFNFV